MASWNRGAARTGVEGKDVWVTIDSGEPAFPAVETLGAAVCDAATWSDCVQVAEAKLLVDNKDWACTVVGDGA